MLCDRGNVARPGLLVSVRTVDEARVALAAGVDVLDVKEPSRGSLGAAEPSVVAEIATIANGCVPLSVAMGELLERNRFGCATASVAYAKLGLAGCGNMPSWRRRWREAVATWTASVRPVAVAYADWRIADAPRPDAVLEVALAEGVAVLLLDTWNKQQGGLFDHWDVAGVEGFCRRVRAAGMKIVLAGSLGVERLPLALECAPDLVAVRGAACEGGRMGRVSAARIQAVRAALQRESSPASDNVLSARNMSRRGDIAGGPRAIGGTEFS